MELEITQLEPYMDCFNSGKRLQVMLSGRGSGKSHGDELDVVFNASFSFERGTSILMLRSTQTSGMDSSKKNLIAHIENYGVQDYFSYSESSSVIVNKLTGVQIIFRGLQDIENLKSFNTCKLAVIEEAETVTQEEWDILSPTIRMPGSVIRVIFNPRYKDNPFQKIVDRCELVDCTYTFRGKEYPYKKYEEDDLYIVSMQYDGNPFIEEGSPLDIERKQCLKYNPENYEWIWLGQLKQEVKDALWSRDDIESMSKYIAFDKKQYDKIIVAVDPATTSKKASNEFGIVVLGKIGNVVRIIDDFSGNMKPTDFAKTVCRAYFDFGADYVVYETNAGGEFISTTILTENPKVVLKGVRASKSKYERALPVAGKSKLGLLLLNKSMPDLTSQMGRISVQGYEGPSGSSPDRLDAMVHGAVDLFALEESATQNKIIRDIWFDMASLKYKVNNRFCYAKVIDGEYYNIIGRVVRDLEELKTVVVVDDIIVDDSIYRDVDNLLLNNNNLTHDSADVIYNYKTEQKQTVDMAMVYLKNGFIRVAPESEEKLLPLITSYSPDKVNKILWSLCEFVASEHGLIEEEY